MADTQNAEPNPPDLLFFSLNEPQVTFGSPISGVVVLVIQQDELQFDSINLQWQGKEKVLLDNNYQQSVIFEQDQKIWTAEPGTALPRGTHTWRFSYALPHNCPSTMEETGSSSGAMPTLPSMSLPSSIRSSMSSLPSLPSLPSMSLPVSMPSFLSGISLPYNPITSRNFNVSVAYTLSVYIQRKLPNGETQVVQVGSPVETAEGLTNAVAQTSLSNETQPPAPAATSEVQTNETVQSQPEESIQLQTNATQSPTVTRQKSDVDVDAVAALPEPVVKFQDLLHSKSEFNVYQRFDPAAVSLDVVEKKASKSSFVGHSPVEIKASVADGGVCFKGGSLLLKLAVLNGTNRPINGVTAQIVYTDKYKANAEEVTFKKAMVTGKVCDSIAPQGFYVQNLKIDIPSNLPPSITLGKLIQRDYELIIEVGVPYYTALSLGLPILIYNPSRHDKIPTAVPTSPAISITAEKNPEKVQESSQEDVKKVQEKLVAPILLEDVLAQNIETVNTPSTTSQPEALTPAPAAHIEQSAAPVTTVAAMAPTPSEDLSAQNIVPAPSTISQEITQAPKSSAAQSIEQEITSRLAAKEQTPQHTTGEEATTTQEYSLL